MDDDRGQRFRALHEHIDMSAIEPLCSHGQVALQPREHYR